jgi:hypothetical protein
MLTGGQWMRAAKAMKLDPSDPDFQAIRIEHQRRIAAPAIWARTSAAMDLVASTLVRWGIHKAVKPMRPVRRFIGAASKKAHRVRPPRSYLLVWELVALIERRTGEHVHHGDKWLDPITDVARAIDPTITKWTVRRALRPRRPRPKAAPSVVELPAWGGAKAAVRATASKDAVEKRSPDWGSIEREYRAGHESVRAIGRRYGVSYEAVRKRARAGGWVRAGE